MRPASPRPTAPEHIETERLVLRRPVPRATSTAIFTTYAGDPEVTR